MKHGPQGSQRPAGFVTAAAPGSTVEIAVERAGALLTEAQVRALESFVAEMAGRVRRR